MKGVFDQEPRYQWLLEEFRRVMHTQKHAGDSSWGRANLTHSLPFRKRHQEWIFSLRF